MQIVLAQNYRARLPQAPHHFGVLRRNAIFEESAGRGRARSGGINQIFQCNGNPMQRPAPLPARDFDFRGPRLPQRRISSHGNKSIQRGIQLLDSFQASAGQINRRNFPSP